MAKSSFFMLMTASCLAACSTTSYQGVSAVAQLMPINEQVAKGKINFSLHQHGVVKVSGQVGGLAPHGTYNLQIQEAKDCNALDTSAAGARKTSSSLPQSNDWPYLQANEHGMAIVQFDATHLQNAEKHPSIIGKSLVVRASKFGQNSAATSAPSYWACGIIESR